jgi:hypothetical protein
VRRAATSTAHPRDKKENGGGGEERAGPGHSVEAVSQQPRPALQPPHSATRGCPLKGPELSAWPLIPLYSPASVVQVTCYFFLPHLSYFPFHLDSFPHLNWLSAL